VILFGLRFGTLEQTKDRLGRRIAYWKRQTATTIPSFRNIKSADTARECLAQRYALLESFRPAVDEKQRAARKLYAAFSARWAGKIDGYLTGTGSDNELHSGAWWQDAGFATLALADVDIALEDEPPVIDETREKLLKLARAKLDEFAHTIQNFRPSLESLPEERQTVWLRALAFRARNIGLALDVLQQRDFDRDADGAYEILMQPAGAVTPATFPPPDLARTLARVRQWRNARANSDPGIPQDVSQAARRRDMLEELYWTAYRMKTFHRDLDKLDEQERQLERERLEQLYLIDVESRPEDLAFRRASRAEYDKAWAKFLADQKERRAKQDKDFMGHYTSRRLYLILQGPRIAGP
jgi:hypothetical protein